MLQLLLLLVVVVAMRKGGDVDSPYGTSKGHWRDSCVAAMTMIAKCLGCLILLKFWICKNPLFLRRR